jgi:hypothetical protein
VDVQVQNGGDTLTVYIPKSFSIKKVVPAVVLQTSGAELSEQVRGWIEGYERQRLSQNPFSGRNF